MKTGILFDLDGTLLDTLADLTDATNYALARFGFPARTMEEVRRAVGNGAANQLRCCAPAGTAEEVIQEILSLYKPYYTGHCQIKTRPYEGIPEVLEAIRANYPVAIVSNKPDSAVKALCADWFPGIYALGETPDCPRKPAADMVAKAMAAIGVEACIYVGDSEVDVQTAKNADVPCLSVLWGFRDREEIREAGGSIFCKDPADLPEMLEAMIRDLTAE